MSQATSGWLPFQVVAGDLNGDGRSDLVVANYSSDSVSVFFGQADGSVQFQAGYAVGSGPKSVAIGDIDGDSKLDLITANYNSNTVSILYGNGDTAVTFKPAITVATGQNPWSVTLGDFDGDGKTDAGIANYTSNTVSILRGTPLLP